MKTIKEILKSKGITEATRYHNYEYLYKAIVECCDEYVGQFNKPDINGSCYCGTCGKELTMITYGKYQCNNGGCKRVAVLNRNIKNKNMEWIKVNDRRPQFDKWVLVWCRIYGTYIGSYQRIDDTNWGNWNDGKQLGVLPPIYWRPLPEAPNAEKKECRDCREPVYKDDCCWEHYKKNIIE